MLQAPGNGTQNDWDKDIHLIFPVLRKKTTNLKNKIPKVSWKDWMKFAILE